MWRGGAKISILLVAMKKYLPAPCLFNSISFGCCCRTGPSVILTGAHTHITCRMQGGSVGVCVGGKHSLAPWAADRTVFCTTFLDGITLGVLLAHRLSADTEMWGACPHVSAVMAGSTAALEVLAGAPYLSCIRAELWSMQGPSHASHLPRPQPDISHLGRIYLQLIFLFFYWEIFRHFQK